MAQQLAAASNKASKQFADMANKPSFFRPWERSPVEKATVAAISSSKLVPELQETPQKSPRPAAMLSLAANYVACTPSPAVSRPACTPSPADSAYSGSNSSCSPASSPSPKASPSTPNLDVLEQWYKQHMDLPYPSNKETKELGRQCGLNFHQVRKWMSKRRSSTHIASSSANSKIYKDSNLHHATPKKSSSAIMQKLRSKPSPYQLPTGIPTVAGGIPTIAAGIPTVLPGAASAAAAATLQLQHAQQYYMYQQEQQTLQAIYLHQLMAAQGLPLQHMQSLHTPN